MKQLTIKSVNGVFVADSREVAEMIGKRHDHLLADIRKYSEILDSQDFGSHEFFIASTYLNAQNKEQPNYLLTKIGCDMVANKMTGEKGVLFTATYVSKFNQMEQQLLQQTKIVPSYMIDDPIQRAKTWITEETERQELHTRTLMLEQRVKEYEPKLTYLDQILQSKDAVTITQIAKDYGLSGTALNQILHEERVQYKQNKQWLLYSKYQDKGFTKSMTLDILHNSGERSVTMNTRWTQKGRLFIHELLSKREIVPFMDRENQTA